MRPLVLQPRNYRRLLWLNGVFLLKNLLVNCLLFLKVLKNFVYLVLYVLFVPMKVYKMESAEVPPKEIHLRDEYQKHQYPPRPFC